MVEAPVLMSRDLLANSQIGYISLFGQLIKDALSIGGNCSVNVIFSLQFISLALPWSGSSR